MPERIKRIEFGYSKRKGAPDMLKIETPFGTVTLWSVPNPVRGRDRLRVDVQPNGERFAGEVPVYLVRGDISRHGLCTFMERQNPRPRKARGIRPPAPGATRPDAPSRAARPPIEPIRLTPADALPVDPMARMRANLPRLD